MIFHLKFNLAVIGVIAGFLLIEAHQLGWENCSLRRLIKRSTASSREDGWWFLAQVTSLLSMLSILCGFGISIAAGRLAVSYLDFNLIVHCPLPLQFLAIVLIDSFLGYWFHRLQHTKRFWVIHKVHHASQEFNGVTTFRTHPLDHVFSDILRGIPMGILGGNLTLVSAYGLANILYEIAVHSDMNWGAGWFGRWVLINPSRHKVHHSSERRQYETNYGSIALWDHLFGTYQEPTPVKAIGFAQANGRPLRSIFRAWWGFVRPFLKLRPRLAPKQRFSTSGTSLSYAAGQHLQAALPIPGSQLISPTTPQHQ